MEKNNYCDWPSFNWLDNLTEGEIWDILKTIGINDSYISDYIIIVLINWNYKDRIFLAQKIKQSSPQDQIKIKWTIFNCIFSQKPDLQYIGQETKKRFVDFFHNIDNLSNMEQQWLSQTWVETICRSSKIKDIEFLEKNKSLIDSKFHWLIENTKKNLLNKTKNKWAKRGFWDIL